MQLSHNLVQLTGRAGHAAELFFLSDGTPFTRFRLYQDDVDSAGKPVCHFFSLTAWGKLAESLHEKVRRGDPLFVQGRLRIISFPQPGGTQKRPEVQLTSFHLLRQKKNVTADGHHAQQSVFQEPS